MDLLEILNFALDNTIVKDMNGKLKRQVKGIPMGDPHSLSNEGFLWYRETARSAREFRRGRKR